MSGALKRNWKNICSLFPRIHRAEQLLPWIQRRQKLCSRVTEEWHFKDLKSFGSLKISSCQNAMFVVQPMDPVDCPQQDKMEVQVSKSGRLSSIVKNSNNVITSDVHANTTTKTVRTSDVNSNAQTQLTSASTSDEKANALEILHCQHIIPVKYNIEARLEDRGSLYVKGLESENITVSTHTGSCTLNSIKSDSICINCGGPVTSQTVLHGNGSIKTRGISNIHIEKALGTNLSLTSEGGNVQIDSLYIDNTQIQTVTSDVHIGACHRNTTVAVKDKGNLTIGSLDGDLTAEINEGSVDVYISQHHNVHIQVNKGDISIKLPESLTTEVQLEASDIVLGETLVYQGDITSDRLGYKTLRGTINGTSDGISLDSKTLRAICTNGTISIDHMDWISSLGLKQG